MVWSQTAGWGGSVNRSYEAENSQGVWVLVQLFRSQKFALYGPTCMGGVGTPIAYGGLRKLKQIAEGVVCGERV